MPEQVVFGATRAGKVTFNATKQRASTSVYDQTRALALDRKIYWRTWFPFSLFVGLALAAFSYYLHRSFSTYNTELLYWNFGLAGALSLAVGALFYPRK